MQTIQKHWYHTTTKDNWRKIRHSGGLRVGSYLAPRKDDLEDSFNWTKGDHLGEVLLRVLYSPLEGEYSVAGRELVTQKPILLENLRIVYDR